MDKRAFTLAEVLITLGVIGVISAMTLPTIIKHYQKQVTVTRLKKAYSELYQAVNMSVSENTGVENWDYTLTGDEFFDKYLKPYIKSGKSNRKRTFSSYNGVTYEIYTHNDFTEIIVDINGNKKPNLLGKDIFIFHVFSKKKDFYNNGNGNIAQNIPVGGLYPDGYGYTRKAMKNDTWRGCNRRNDKSAKGYGIQAGAFCTALIMLDGWKIEDDYLW